MNRDHAILEIERALNEAEMRFDAMASPHEGYAVILEELDELWVEVKDNKRPSAEYAEAMRAEALHVAAMALRFLVDIC